jgi:hypothetical protein
MGAVVDDDRGQGDAAEVGQGVLVIAGGDAALGCVKDLGQFLALLIKQRLLLVGGR